MARIIFPNGKTAAAAAATTEVLDYKKFIEEAEGAISLRGRYLEDEAGRKTLANEFLKKLMEDSETALTPELRYASEDQQANVSPLTRARHSGWAIGKKAFISINVMLGLTQNGQLLEVRSTRSRPRPTGKASQRIDYVLGQWGPRESLDLFVVDDNGTIEYVESWLARVLSEMAQ